LNPPTAMVHPSMLREMSPVHGEPAVGKPGRGAPPGGARPGICCGIIFFIVSVSFLMDGCAMVVTAFGPGGYQIVPLRTHAWSALDFSEKSTNATALRELQTWDWYQDHQEREAQRLKEEEDARKLQQLINGVVGAVIFLAQCLTAVFYWRYYVVPTREKYLPRGAKAPANLRGQFLYQCNDCFSATGTCCCFCWCTLPMLGDLWYRSGWVHSAVGNDTNGCCKAWQYCAALGFLFGLHCTFCGQCFPIVQSFTRNGCRSTVGQASGRYSEYGDLRSRFEIPANGICTFLSDCCLWCCCFACAGTQEYRHVMHLLENGYDGPQQAVAVGQVDVGQVVGSPVTVVQEVKP